MMNDPGDRQPPFFVATRMGHQVAIVTRRARKGLLCSQQSLCCWKWRACIDTSEHCVTVHMITTHSYRPTIAQKSASMPQLIADAVTQRQMLAVDTPRTHRISTSESRSAIRRGHRPATCPVQVRPLSMEAAWRRASALPETKGRVRRGGRIRACAGATPGRRCELRSTTDARVRGCRWFGPETDAAGRDVGSSGSLPVKDSDAIGLGLGSLFRSPMASSISKYTPARRGAGGRTCGGLGLWDRGKWRSYVSRHFPAC